MRVNAMAMTAQTGNFFWETVAPWIISGLFGLAIGMLISLFVMQWEINTNYIPKAWIKETVHGSMIVLPPQP